MEEQKDEEEDRNSGNSKLFRTPRTFSNLYSEDWGAGAKAHSAGIHSFHDTIVSSGAIISTFFARRRILFSDKAFKVLKVLF